MASMNNNNPRQNPNQSNSPSTTADSNEVKRAVGVIADWVSQQIACAFKYLGKKSVQGATAGAKLLGRGIKATHNANKPYYGTEAAGLITGSTIGVIAAESAIQLNDGINTVGPKVVKSFDAVKAIFADDKREVTQEVKPAVTSEERPNTPNESGYSAAFIDAINAKTKTRRLQNDYAIIIKGNAKKMVPGSNLSRLEYAKKIFSKTDLPNDLKAILPYVPFAESTYRDDLVSSDGAKGAWQFMPYAGKKYGIKIDTTVDERTDFVQSTEAAAKYYKYIYTYLSTLQDYKKLEKQYGLKPADFLVPATINSYQCGEGHFAKMIEILANPNKYGINQSEISKAAKSGGGGLYMYIKYLYRLNCVKWQRSFPRGKKYGIDSFNYAIKIEAFRQLDKGKPLPVVNVEEAQEDAEELKEEFSGEESFTGYSELSPSIGAVIGASTVGALAGIRSVYNYIKDKKNPETPAKEVDHTRRGFLKLSSALAGGAMAGAIETKTRIVSSTISSMLGDTEKTKHFNISNEEDAEKLYIELQAKYGVNISNMEKKVKTDSDITNGKFGGTYAKSRYQDNQWMGDAGNLLYLETKDKAYLDLSEYFYRVGYMLARNQKEGVAGYKIPNQGHKVGMARVDDRLVYCNNALGIINELRQIK